MVYAKDYMRFLLYPVNDFCAVVAAVQLVVSLKGARSCMLSEFTHMRLRLVAPTVGIAWWTTIPNYMKIYK